MFTRLDVLSAEVEPDGATNTKVVTKMAVIPNIICLNLFILNFNINLKNPIYYCVFENGYMST